MNSLICATSNRELYHSNATSAGDSYTPASGNGYDAFNRLTNFRRGTLSALPSSNYGNLDTVTNTALATSTGSVKSWSLDAQGNWTSSASGTGNGTNSPAAPTSTSRTNNRQNQVTAVSGSTSPAYDNNGNVTTDETGKSFTYDAWNDMVSVSGFDSPTYQYDALGQSPASATSPCGGGTNTTNMYYTTGWQEIEEDLTVSSGSGSTTTIQNQNTWGLGYVDALVARYDNSSSGSLGKSGSGLGGEIFVQQDANFNVTSLSSTAGAIIERFIYDPYGSFQVLTSAWASTTDSYNWKYLFQDLAYDSTTGLFNGRNRMYSPTLGRWMQMDPTGADYVDRMNLYQVDDSSPTDFVDPWGLDAGTAYHRVQGTGTPVDLENGGAIPDFGKVSVWTDAKENLDGQPDVEKNLSQSGIWIQFEPDKQCKKCHWLQIADIIIKDEETKKVLPKTVEVGPPGHKYYVPTNYPFVDVLPDSKTPFFEDTGISRALPNGGLAIFDPPTGEVKKGETKTIVFDDYLICDDVLRYHIQWTITSDSKHSRKFDVTESGVPKNVFGAARGDSLSGPYSDKDSAQQPTFSNPIPKGQR